MDKVVIDNLGINLRISRLEEELNRIYEREYPERFEESKELCLQALRDRIKILRGCR